MPGVNQLHFVLVQNHTFVGKALPEVEGLVDVIEFIPMINPQGGINLQAVILGEIITLPPDILTIALSKESPYWQAYYRASLKISNA